MGLRLHLQSVKFLASQRLEGILRDESGQDLIEYALIFCLVMLGVVASMKSLQANIAVVFAAVGTTLTSAT